METQNTVKQNWHNIDIKGRYLLTYKVSNNLGIDAFGGYHLPVYKNPYNGQKTYLKNADSKPLNGYMVDKLTKQLLPEENIEDHFVVSWLICHPEVKLEGIEMDDVLKKSKTGHKITLKALDQSSLDAIDRQDFQDQLIGRLSITHGPESISLKKARYILAYLNLSYSNSQYANDEATEKKVLKGKIKNIIRKSYEDAAEVDKALKNMDIARNIYEFKEMVNKKVLVLKNGVYRFNDAPIGSSQDQVLLFFTNNPEVHVECMNELEKRI